MIKYSKYIFVLLLGIQVIFSGCEDQNYELAELVTPSNVQVTFEIEGLDGENPYGDGSGLVHFTATADDNITFNYMFGDGQDNKIAPSGKITHQFSKNGVNIYNVTVLAVGTGGITSSKTVQVEVFSSFSDEEALEFLTGGSSKTWYWAADQPGHLGLGPNDQKYEDNTHTYDYWYSAGAFEKSATCMYDAEFVFTNNDGQLTFEHINPTGQSFFQGDNLGIVGGSEEGCYEYDFTGVKNAAFAPANSIATEDGGYRGTMINISDGGFMGFYVGSSNYEIISVSSTLLKVRVESTGQPVHAWYHTFTTEKPSEGEDLDVIYTDLVWEDNFDTDGAPSATNWTYDMGTGDNGWGNGESQYYTDRTDNVVVADGMLKITAKKEDYEGSAYTSARLKSQGLYSFTYGRVDIRAKLPEGGGTWPALWMLGDNFDTVGWPACGEIDIMEAIGNDPGHVQAAIHTPSSSGATENMGATTVADASDEFHVYSVNWSPNQITFLVDDEIYYTYKPLVQNADTWPFDAGQFIIMNIAMGGSLGGTIDPAFTEAVMEIDYVKVYQ